MLLKEIQQRLFEGLEWSMLPMKGSSKGLLFQLAGILVSHSIAQGMQPRCMYSLNYEDKISRLMQVLYRTSTMVFVKFMVITFKSTY